MPTETALWNAHTSAAQSLEVDQIADVEFIAPPLESRGPLIFSEKNSREANIPCIQRRIRIVSIRHRMLGSIQKIESTDSEIHFSLSNDQNLASNPTWMSTMTETDAATIDWRLFVEFEPA